jgi:O-antigen/teichoic acid export membrane protein
LDDRGQRTNSATKRAGREETGSYHPSPTLAGAGDDERRHDQFSGSFRHRLTRPRPRVTAHHVEPHRETPEPVEAQTGGSPRTLGVDVVLMFGNKGLLLALNVALSVVLARALGVQGRGELGVALAFAAILLQFGTFGLITANPYFIARDARSIPSIVANSLWFAVGLGGLLVVAAIVIKAQFPWLVAGLGWPEVLVVAAGVPAALATVFWQSVLLGEGRTIAYNAVEVAHGILVTGITAFALIALGAGVLTVLIVISAFYFIAACVYAVLLLRHSPRFLGPDPELARRMLGYAFRIYVTTLIAFLVIRLDLLLVNSYLGKAQAGLYAVVASLAEGMYLLPVVIGVNLFPRLARGEGDELSASVFRIVFVLYGALCLVSVPLAGPGIHLLFGAQFDGATDLYYWIVPGIFSLGMLTILSHHFAGRGYPMQAMVIWIIGLVLNLALNVAFLQSEGTYIASLASSVAYTFLLVLHMRLFARDAGGWQALRPRIGETARFVSGAVSAVARR